ncbi:MAG TPA: glycosyltransferase family 9 protein [Ktedonobacteraceae bacterium]|nr:glycosyltransferase family 9 protein [Ktedonobacteraceae bacterium]
MKRLLRTLMLLLIRLLGAPRAWAATKQVREPLPAAPCILLIRPDHLGDLVLTTPVLHALRQHAPDAQITMMIGPWSSEIVARHPDIDRLLTCSFPGFQRASQRALAPYMLLLTAAKQLRRGHYDLAINLRPDFWWGAALMYLARIPHRIGYALEPGKPFLTTALPFHSPEHAAVSNLRLASAALETLGLSPLAEPYSPAGYPLQFIPTEEEQRWVTQRLSGEGIDAEMPFVVIHPGTGAAVKLWRTEAWARCADALTKSSQWSKPMRIILTGSRNERPMLEEIASTMTTPAIIVTNATVGQLAALLGRAQMVLAVDNGPAHLAVAQGTPTVELFGPTDYRIFGPWGGAEKHVVLASTERCPTCACIPCGRLDFSPAELPAHPCVRLIREQQVLAAIEKLYQTCQQKSN